MEGATAFPHLSAAKYNSPPARLIEGTQRRALAIVEALHSGCGPTRTAFELWMPIVAVAVAIEMMIVFHPFTARALPVTREILLPVMMRLDPERTFVGRTAVITGMPPVVTADRVPVTTNPCIAGSRTCGLDVDPRGRRRADADTKRYLAVSRLDQETSAREKQCRE